MNCQLDGKDCVVAGSRRGRRNADRGIDSVVQPFPTDYGDGVHNTSTRNMNLQSESEVELAAPTTDSSYHRAVGSGDEEPGLLKSSSAHRRAFHDRHIQDNGEHGPRSAGPLASNKSLPEVQWIQHRIVASSSYVPYSSYPFISTRGFLSIPPQDYQFLESQGCLHLPTRPILDDFVRQYFLHMHPMLPLLDEADFWSMYSNNIVAHPSRTDMSLLVFQAMLFACCNFVSSPRLKSLGLSTTRIARAAFYRRAKLLFDLESECCPIALSQAALLLSSWSLSSSAILRSPSIPWLSIAIRHAKIANAHHYGALDTLPESYGVLKRLWWCCIIRDCIFSMGMRRGIQISRAHFDFQNNAVLGVIDLSHEVDHSKVHEPDTKRQLAEILELLVELCIVLTGILALVFPLEDSPGWREVRPDDQEKVRCHKKALRRWHRSAVLRLAAIGMQPPPYGQETQHDNVILYTKLLFMYYYSARAVLCHHEILQLATVAMASPGISLQVLIIEDNRHELRDAASGTTECLKELLRLGLAQWLPISAVTCTALPLLLHMLDLRVLSASRAPDPSQLHIKQDRLNVLVAAMKAYQPQYDSVDWIGETIRQVIHLAQLDCDQPLGPLAPGDSGSHNSSGSGSGSCEVMADWTDILSSRPSWYLRLALTIDLSLSKGRLPEDRDFPPGLGDYLSGNMIQGRPLQNRHLNEMSSFGNDYLGPIAEMGTDVWCSEIKETLPQAQRHPMRAISLDEGTGQPDMDMNQGRSGTAEETLPSLTRQLGRGELLFAIDEPVEGFGGLAEEVLDMLAGDHSSGQTRCPDHADSGRIGDGKLDENL